MGLFDKFLGKREPAPENGKALLDLAFVLLSEAQLPNAAEITQAFRDFAAPEENLEVESGQIEKAGDDTVIRLRLNTGETGFVALIPAPIPNGEADSAAQFSVSSFRNGWKLPPHCAHLIVTAQAAGESTPLVRLSRFTSLLAAVTKASPAVGIYWGNAGATHDSEFFLLVASEREIVPRMALWSGVSIAREKDGRLSLLSLGMKQLNLPDLYLIAGSLSPNEAMATMFDLLSYIADRGQPLPEGDTIGRTDDQKIPVHYVRSPRDPAKKVCRVVFP